MSAYLTHYDIFENPFGSDAACGFTAEEAETFGMTSLSNLVTCPDCILRLEASQ